MEETKIKRNSLGIKIFINGIPDFSTIEKDDFDIFATVLELTLVRHYESYTKRKSRDSPK